MLRNFFINYINIKYFLYYTLYYFYFGSMYYKLYIIIKFNCNTVTFLPFKPKKFWENYVDILYIPPHNFYPPPPPLCIVENVKKYF